MAELLVGRRRPGHWLPGDPARDADLLSRSRRTATGGWIVRLTEAPLVLDIPAHLDALLRAYERFPLIGGRVTPPSAAPR